MKTVMIVDDASTVRMFHKMLVSSDDRVVEEAENGVEALEKAIGTPIDLFLVDVNMPKMDGYRLCKEIRQNELLRAVPIIMISTEFWPIIGQSGQNLQRFTHDQGFVRLI